MDSVIENKIKIYCKKCNLKMDQLFINCVEEGYMATDGYTSIMFDKEGSISSLPMHQVYGKKTTKLLGNLSVIYMYVIFALAILAIIIGIVK